MKLDKIMIVFKKLTYESSVLTFSEIKCTFIGNSKRTFGVFVFVYTVVSAAGFEYDLRPSIIFR